MTNKEDVAFTLIEGGIITAKVAFVAGVASLAVYGFSSRPAESTDPTQNQILNSEATTCTSSNTRPLPTSTNVSTVLDTRQGDVYACQYLMDLSIPSNKPMPLYKTTNEVYDVQSSQFKQSGSLSGFAILGTGLISGDVQASGSGQSERKRVYVVRAEDSNNELRTMVLDAEKVAIKPCQTDKSCKPSIEFDVPKSPLWVKDPGRKRLFLLKSQAPDRSSIWLASGMHGDKSLDATRQNVVNQLSINKIDESVATGGPDKPGQVVSALANKIVLTLPADAIQ